MAKNRSDASKYPSRYSPDGWVTAAQFIIELVCEAQAKKDCKELPLKFWTHEEWQAEFKSQTRATARLLKKYEPKAIINAIQSKKIWSLRPKWVEGIIKKEQEAIDGKRLMQKAETGDKPKDDVKIVVPNKTRAPRSSPLSKLFTSDEV